MRRAVFLDRDGTISEEVGYVNHIDRFRVFPWSAEAVLGLNRAGIAAVLVTNQSGVARGYFPEQLLHETHRKLEAVLAKGGATLDAVYYCPHLPDGKVPAFSRVCECRKPAPGMIRRAARDLDLDLGGSFIVSDRYQDLSMGFAAGMTGVLVLTGYGLGESTYQRAMWPRPPDHIAANLLEAVNWILNDKSTPIA
jgi:D-glycero-D-manno-heptose 1,7-bisphosphate phosphatase